jgi:tetrapyrrole methylase family protein/MazG family protein
VLEAIDTENKVLLEEELGDVLLQVVFHSQISKEYAYALFGYWLSVILGR